MHESLKVSTKELYDRNNEVMQVKLNDLSGQLSSNNESIVSAKKASDEMYNALQAKVDSSTESHKAELNLLKERSATLESNLDSMKDNIISEVTTAQADDQDLRIWKLTAGATMQLQLDMSERNLLIIGIKQTWNPKATSYEIYKEFARSSLQISEEENDMNIPQDVDVRNRQHKTRKPSMLVKYYSLEHK